MKVGLITAAIPGAFMNSTPAATYSCPAASVEAYVFEFLSF